MLRTKAGGIFRGVNTGVVQNTPGGGIGGFGSSVGAGAGGTNGGAGGAGSGASGLVSSTLGTGTNVSSYDPAITGSLNYQSQNSPLSNLAIYGVPCPQGRFPQRQRRLRPGLPHRHLPPVHLQLRPRHHQQPLRSSCYRSSIPASSSSPASTCSPASASAPTSATSASRATTRKSPTSPFELQVISTVTQIANIYWDLVAAYEDEQVKQASLDFANDTLTSARKQLDLQAIPALDVLKDEAEVANREQDLSIAKSQLQFQSLLIKNALTKNLDDPMLEAMPVRPLEATSHRPRVPHPFRLHRKGWGLPPQPPPKTS